MRERFFCSTAILLISLIVTCRSTEAECEGLMSQCPDQNAILPCVCSTRMNCTVIVCWKTNVTSLQLALKGIVYPIWDLEILAYESAMLPTSAFEEIYLRNLYISYSDVEELMPGDFNGARGLAYLYISHNEKLRTVHGDAFLGLVNVTTLDISRNNITDIRSRAFSSLGKVQQIDVSWNAVRTLPSGVFAGLKKLRSLDMSRNNVSTIPPDVFKETDAVTDINFDKNALTNITKGSFAALKNLTFLSLKFNRISTIESGTFSKHNRLLNFVDLTANRVTKLSEGLLSGLQNLKTLILSSNQLTAIDSRALANDNLDTLKLDNNKLNEIDKDVFTQLPNLKTLHLDNNQLYQPIDKRSFVKLQQLVTLYLHGNAIQTINAEAFASGFDSLQHVTLDFNLLHTIHVGTFSSLPKLVYLGLSHNILQTVHEEALPDHTIEIDLRGKQPALKKYVYSNSILINTVLKKSNCPSRR